MKLGNFVSVNTMCRSAVAAGLMVIMLGLGLVNAAPAAAQNTPTAVVSTGSLNVRSGPGVGYEVLYVVQHKQTVTMIGRNAGTTWIKIRTPQGDGWVNRNMIWPNFPVERLGVISVSQLNLAAAVTTGSLNVRSGPGTDYPIINRVGLDAVIGISGRTSGGSWVLIDSPASKAGWVNATHLNVYGNLFSLPVSNRTLPAPAGGATSSGTTTTNRAATTTVSAANATSWPEFIYIRQGPDRSATPLQTIYAGTSLTMLSRTGDTEWIQVRSAEGTTGYVLSIELRPTVPFNRLSVAGSSGNTPATGQAASSGNTPVAGSGDVTVRGSATVFVEGLNIRSGPSLTAQIVDGVYYNARLSIVGRTADNAWVKIIAPNGTVGWVSSQFIWTSVYVYTLPVVN